MSPPILKLSASRVRSLFDYDPKNGILSWKVAKGRIKVGDIVTIGQCRPLSKTVRFNVLKVQPNTIFGSVKKQFMLF